MGNCFNHSLRRDFTFDGTNVANLLADKEVTRTPKKDDVIVYFQNEKYAVHASIFLDETYVSTKWGLEEPKICTHAEDQKKFPHQFITFFPRNVIDSSI